MGKKEEKSPLLTKLERKQLKDDEEECQVYVEKLNKESNDYDATLSSWCPFSAKNNSLTRNSASFSYVPTRISGLFI
ncbi:hypothetical protein CTI12_AA280580 [Artemisia annua]|uniref:Uncharacterized protein n=1 Tax=Artemisia annua TaxID=35608 RepID=A0A2U1ND84_ARTAN|nr:hypothetical protein CTI12_AA280580 [Artemisia annua]